MPLLMDDKAQKAYLVEGQTPSSQSWSDPHLSIGLITQVESFLGNSEQMAIANVGAWNKA